MSNMTLGAMALAELRARDEEAGIDPRTPTPAIDRGPSTYGPSIQEIMAADGPPDYRRDQAAAAAARATPSKPAPIEEELPGKRPPAQRESAVATTRTPLLDQARAWRAELLRPDRPSAA